MYLASQGEDVLLEVGGYFGVGVVVGLAVEQGEMGGIDRDSFFED